MSIENVRQKGVKLFFDRDRIVTFPMVALGYLAEVFGSVPEAFAAFQDVLPKKSDGEDSAAWRMDAKTIKTMTHFITAGLLAEDPTITFQEVGQVLDMENMAAVITAVSNALIAYMPAPKAGSEDPQKRSK